MKCKGVGVRGHRAAPSSPAYEKKKEKYKLLPCPSKPPRQGKLRASGTEKTRGGRPRGEYKKRSIFKISLKKVTVEKSKSNWRL